MKAFTTLASAAALALAIGTGAHAAVFAQFSPDTNASDYKWIQHGTGGEFISVNANTDTTAQGVATHFDYLAPAYATVLNNLAATFTVDATAASGNPAVRGGGATLTQTGLDGSFSFIYSGPTQDIGGFHLVSGVTNLLSGTFTDAWIQGAGHSGSANVTLGNGGAVTSFTSDVVNFSNVHDGEFAFNLLNATFAASGSCPNAGDHCTSALHTFTANGGGNFSANGVPEPATWGLMIVGFGGMGLVLRNRRRPALANA